MQERKAKGAVVDGGGGATIPDCIHHFVFPTEGETSIGVCIKCGALSKPHLNRPVHPRFNTWIRGREDVPAPYEVVKAAMRL